MDWYVSSSCSSDKCLVVDHHARNGNPFHVSGSEAKATPEGAPIDGGGKQDNGMRGERVRYSRQPNEWIGTFPRQAAPTNASLLIITWNVASGAKPSPTERRGVVCGVMWVSQYEWIKTMTSSCETPIDSLVVSHHAKGNDKPHTKTLRQTLTHTHLPRRGTDVSSAHHPTAQSIDEVKALSERSGG